MALSSRRLVIEAMPLLGALLLANSKMPNIVPRLVLQL